jgi:hypothetical protein
MGGVLWGLGGVVRISNAWVLAGGGIALGAGVYLLVTFLLRSPELTFVLDAVRRRWRQ